MRVSSTSTQMMSLRKVSDASATMRELDTLLPLPFLVTNMWMKLEAIVRVGSMNSISSTNFGVGSGKWKVEISLTLTLLWSAPL